MEMPYGTAGPSSGEGAQGELKKGSSCFYITRDGDLQEAKVQSVDQTISPPGFEIFIPPDRYIATERERLLTMQEGCLRLQQRQGL
mmetsp:Transcript_12848/g.26524  ORF Transcript_12848/g.26524 Transcript_12848/m.26524 type:complete len:86 (+) Transcript_12848:1-258(+)